jgi:uncharacterized membrane protein YfcA
VSILALIAALTMGFVLGLLGGGGSILAVPILVFLLGVPAKAAIATSLLVVGTTSAFAVIGHARRGNVVWRTGAIFGAFAMLGSFGGGRLAAFIPGNVLMMLFAALMLVTAIAMLRGRKEETSKAAVPPTQLPIAKVAVEGIVVGGITGLVGAGGGFLVVPALAILGGLDMRKAIGTSLMVIAMKSFAGFAGYAGHVQIDYGLVGTFVIAAVVGTVLGTQTARLIDASRLRTAFATFVLAMGAFIFAQKLGFIDLGTNANTDEDRHAQVHEVADDGLGA